MGLRAPDKGLVKALKQGVPQGPAVDLGCGNGRNTWFMARYCQPAIGYDLEGGFREEIEKMMRCHGVTFGFEVRDVLGLSFPPQSLAVIGIGVSIYNPKDVVEKLLRQAFVWLMPGGVLHMDFATYQDGSYQTDFVQSACYEVAIGSFVRWCSNCAECYLMGKNGGSFWEPQEVNALIQTLGSVKIIHAEVVDFAQIMTQEDDTQHKFQRSFYQVTLRKI